MKYKLTGAAWTLWCLTAIVPASVGAQPLDQLGNRAGALGAFVAVADDASAVAWNPAGLINGPFFNVLLDFGTRATEPGRARASLLAFGLPPLGISYYRLHQEEPAVASSPDRKNRQVIVRSLVTSHLGVTVLQSLTDGVAAGATIKLVRGTLNDGDGHTTADVDAGVLASRGRMRLGLVVRNLTAPTFENGDASAALDRHVRAGLAWGDAWPATAKLIVSLDADLTRVAHPSGERRDIAAGAERWLRSQTIAIRGGVRASTVGDARPIPSAGGSYAVRRGMYVDFYAAAGPDAHGWGVAARLMY